MIDRTDEPDRLAVVALARTGPDYESRRGETGRFPLRVTEIADAITFRVR